MTSPSPLHGRPRRPGAGWGLVPVLAVACACGRLGYDPIDLGPSDGGTGTETARDADAGDAGTPDATVSGDAGPTDASEAAALSSTDSSDATISGDAGDASAASDVAAPPPDAAPDGAADTGPDAACVTSSIVNYCTALPFLAAPPIIDGVLDCGPTLLAVVPIGWTGPGVVPAGNSAKLAAAWRPDGLYFFIDVTDPSLVPADPGDPPWYGDGAEIYADNDGVFPNAPAYDDGGTTVQLVVAAPSSATSTSTTAEMYRAQVDDGPWTSTHFGAFGTKTGFVLEAFVVAADLDLSTWPLAPDQTIGFNIAVNVSYPAAGTTGSQGNRLGQYFLYWGPSPASGPFTDVRSFCTPTLSP